MSTVPLPHDDRISSSGIPALVRVGTLSAIDVLVVDDDEDMRAALAEEIRAFGYECHEAVDGAEAWEMLQAHTPAIVVTDWMMPRMTGIELCVKIKSTLAPPAPYVFLMTAFQERARLLAGLRAGADDFLRKPIDIDELEVRLIAASRTIHAQRALVARNLVLKRDSERSFRDARVDALTGVSNRLRFNEDLPAVAANARRYGRRCSIAMVDVDYFKHYNDRHGHIAGDVALQKIAAAIRESVRVGDTVYRYGGEEFVVVMPEQGEAAAAQAMERVRAAVQALALPHQPVSPVGVVTVSIGVAELRAPAAPASSGGSCDSPANAGGSCDEWLAGADAALYQAKAHGRNCVSVDQARGR